MIAHTGALASAAGQDILLDSDLVRAGFTWTVSSDRARVRVPGGWGPVLEPPPGADEQMALMALRGRGSRDLRGCHHEVKGDTMPDITQELAIEAPPETVFAAITRPDGLTHWWANRVVSEPTVGSHAEFRFDNGEVMMMEITDLAMGQNVSWLVRQAPQYAHLWEGTTITWDLVRSATGTTLYFGHHGFAVADVGYEQTRIGWDYFLGSLKAYVETGVGTPYVR